MFTCSKSCSGTTRALTLRQKRLYLQRAKGVGPGGRTVGSRGATR